MTRPNCQTCGFPMLVRMAAIRTPERYLQCSTCGTIEDVTIEQYYGDAPAPEWFTTVTAHFDTPTPVDTYSQRAKS